MSRQQRILLDASLRTPRPEGPRSIEAMRAGFAAPMATKIVPHKIRTTEVTLGGRRALLVEPTERERPGTILYFHGGSLVFGSPETALSLTGNLVVRTGLRALSLDYRLAPEHPFPVAIGDALEAYRALLEGGEDPSTIAFAGDSAGGGLTITTCLAARTAALPLPAAIVCFSPGLDATRTGESIDTRADADPFFTRRDWGTPPRCTSPARTRARSCSVPRSWPTSAAFLQCCSRWAPTKCSWTIRRAWPPVRAQPE